MTEYHIQTKFTQKVTLLINFVQNEGNNLIWAESSIGKHTATAAMRSSACSYSFLGRSSIRKMLLTNEHIFNLHPHQSRRNWALFRIQYLNLVVQKDNGYMVASNQSLIFLCHNK